LQELVVDAMTISETSWFRDRLPFDALRDHVLPELARTIAPRELQLWSAACATGQEVYSLAMVVDEWLQEHPMWTARVLGTDRAQSLLDRARTGVYSQLEINRGLPVAALMRHFDRNGTQWRICDRVRRLVELRQINLGGSIRGLPPMDVIFLRNVLIYFDVDTKREVLRRVAEVLRPGGLLFLGASETTLHLGLDFERCDIGGAVCYRVSGGASS
jgi:chemotaxis protein methyltransferase CheR